MRKTKTDKRASSIIAEFLRIHAETLLQQKSSFSELRVLARERERIAKEIASLKNGIKRLIYILFPELFTLINPFTHFPTHFFLFFSSKQTMLDTFRRGILEIWFPQKRGKRSAFLSCKILSVAKKSIGITSSLYKEILKSIRGIKDITYVHFIAETEDIKRFFFSKKLVVYIRLDPSFYEFKEFREKGRISKRGNRSLRRVLCLMATSVVRVNEIFREYFLKKIAQGKSYKYAMMAVIHKLLRIIYVLLTR